MKKTAFMLVSLLCCVVLLGCAKSKKMSLKTLIIKQIMIVTRMQRVIRFVMIIITPTIPAALSVLVIEPLITS